MMSKLAESHWGVTKTFLPLELGVKIHFPSSQRKYGHVWVFYNEEDDRSDIPHVSHSYREIPAIAECCPKLGWDIKKDRHAALVMIDANHHEIRFEGRLHRFIQNKPEVADKAFVTKVYRCSAYARLITEHGRSGQIYVGYKANIDSTSTTSIATSTSSTGAAQAWQVFSDAGNWSTGPYHPSPPAYTPLVTIRQITPKEPASGFREPIPPAIADADEMQDYILPWGDLEEDGEEVDPDD
jgi:hypothetical protein